MKLENKKIAILATDGFEKSELFQPLEALQAQGASITIISDKLGEIKSWDKNNWGKSINVDLEITKASIDNFDALLLPGGVINPDMLRINDSALTFVRSCVLKGKTVAAICHAPWLLINAGVAKGKRLTSYKSIKEDLINAEAHWEDSPVVVDKNLVTSRNPKDIPVFIEKFIENIIAVKSKPSVLKSMNSTPPEKE